jgi:hypothetical protein
VLENPKMTGIGNEGGVAIGQFLRYVTAHPPDDFVIFTLPEVYFDLNLFQRDWPASGDSGVVRRSAAALAESFETVRAERLSQSQPSMDFSVVPGQLGKYQLQVLIEIVVSEEWK